MNPIENSLDEELKYNKNDSEKWMYRPYVPPIELNYKRKKKEVFKQF